MVIGLLKEKGDENRVSMLADSVAALVNLKATIWFESGAGANAMERDAVYLKAGAVTKTRDEILSQSDILLGIHPLSNEDIAKVKVGVVAIGVFQPLFNYRQMQLWAEKNVTAFSLDMLPRTTRAQSMDVLSSQASIAGYKAVLLAANTYHKYFPMLMTAAGTVTPAKVLILGAGVAGLQAIATARRLGAVVEVFDTRPAVKEEVMSLGAKFVEVEGAADPSKAGGYAVEQTEDYKKRQQQRIHDAIVKANIVISTAQIPGKKAPILITREMLDNMENGSVVIDLAASTGGNSELTKNGETIVYNGVTIIGNSNLPSGLAGDSSKLYGKNVLNFLKLMVKPDGTLNLNFEDDLIKGACITHNRKVVNERVFGLINQN